MLAKRLAGRYKAVIKTISGVYSSESKRCRFRKKSELTEEFAKKRSPSRVSWLPRWDRMDTTTVAKVVATGYADCGFDVDMGPLFQTPPKLPVKLWKTMFMQWAFHHWLPDTRLWFRNSWTRVEEVRTRRYSGIAGGVIPAKTTTSFIKQV